MERQWEKYFKLIVLNSWVPSGTICPFCEWEIYSSEKGSNVYICGCGIHKYDFLQIIELAMNSKNVYGNGKWIIPY